MKKLLALLLAMVMVLCLCACGGEETADDGEEKETTEQKEDTEKTDNNGNSAAEMVDVWIIEGITNDDGKLELEYDKDYNLQKLKTQIMDEEGDDPIKLEMRLTFNTSGKILSEMLFGDYQAEGYYGGEAYVYGYDIYGNEMEDGVEYQYDKSGNVVEASNEWSTTYYTYDAAGKLISEETVDEYGSSTTTYAYDANGNLLKEQSGSWVGEYTYNADGKMVTSRSGGDGYEWLETYEYDANGELVKMSIVAEYMFSGERIIAFEYKKVTVTKEQAAAIEEQKAYVYENIFTMFW